MSWENPKSSIYSSSLSFWKYWTSFTSIGVALASPASSAWCGSGYGNWEHYCSGQWHSQLTETRPGYRRCSAVAQIRTGTCFLSLVSGHNSDCPCHSAIGRYEWSSTCISLPCLRSSPRRMEVSVSAQQCSGTDPEWGWGMIVVSAVSVVGGIGAVITGLVIDIVPRPGNETGTVPVSEFWEVKKNCTTARTPTMSTLQ